MNQQHRRALAMYFGVKPGCVKPGYLAQHSKGEKPMFKVTECDHIVVANAPRIPCSIRTLKPYYYEGPKPFVHAGQLGDALLYLASRAALPEEDLRALKELLERLSSSLQALQERESVIPQDNVEMENAPIDAR